VKDKIGIGAALVLLVLSCFSPMASAQYGHGGYSGAHPYYRNVWSGWVYAPWASDSNYYTFYRTKYDDCGIPTNHNDGWLYCLKSPGCYEKHCKIADYSVKVPARNYIEPRGCTEVGYCKDEYELVKRYPFAAGLTSPKDLPGTIDPRSLVATFDSQALARMAFAEKSFTSTKDMALKIAEGEQAKELEQIRGRNALARQIQADQNEERAFAEFKEYRATARREALIDNGAATPRAVINVGNPSLAGLIQDRCVSCHGPGKAEAGLNFANVAATDFKVWQKSFRKCATGEMPKGGEPLSNEELDLFDEQYQLALKAR